MFLGIPTLIEAGRVSLCVFVTSRLLHAVWRSKDGRVLTKFRRNTARTVLSPFQEQCCKNI